MKRYSFFRIFLCTACCLAALPAVAGDKTQTLTSPDGRISIGVTTGNDIRWSVRMDGTEVLLSSPLSLTLADGSVLGENPKVNKVSFSQVDSGFDTPFYKKSRVGDSYKRLLLYFRKHYALEFRAYNDGVAYRFLTEGKKELYIKNEEAVFRFPGDPEAFVAYVNDMRGGERYSNAFEAYYDHLRLSEMKPDSLSFAPVLVDLGNGRKAAVMEGGLEDYPGMFLTGGFGDGSLKAAFAPYPLEGRIQGLNFIATKRADYIAKVPGKGSLPWRALALSRHDVQLLDNDLAMRLAAPSRLKDISWIKPGKVAWDWWNACNLTHVDFLAGINTPTYKYFIDFAAANHLQYIILDEGWSRRGDLMQVNPEVNIPEIVNYGKQKGVGVILWASWHDVSRQMDTAFPHYAALGVKGFKVDFFDSDDQKMIQSVFLIAKTAAANHLVLDFHGMHPLGLNRTYPNVLNFEGVKGMENEKGGWLRRGSIQNDMPPYDAAIPFIRNLAGPMDYTPGAMDNATRRDYRPIGDRPMSQGTRAHQLAMYVVFFGPLQMLSDSPTNYMREQECTNFIDSIPTVFDETRGLAGEVGKYVVTARRKGSTWFVGALSNWGGYQAQLPLSFLGKGTYRAVIFKDGPNADRNATDYVKETREVTASDSLPLHLYSGGGWAARFTPVGN
ncbi:MAG: glycoside hydrolase family 97 protein [Tannerella sp.]|jgi:alpha-glucosidase|nr:glycoside hydrolase family 97 protein [Tannerella sp.]